jgi:hypothetical protein
MAVGGTPEGAGPEAQQQERMAMGGTPEAAGPEAQQQERMAVGGTPQAAGPEVQQQERMAVGSKPVAGKRRAQQASPGGSKKKPKQAPRGNTLFNSHLAELKRQGQLPEWPATTAWDLRAWSALVAAKWNALSKDEMQVWKDKAAGLL